MLRTTFVPPSALEIVTTSLAQTYEIMVQIPNEHGDKNTAQDDFVDSQIEGNNIVPHVTDMRE